ncbi:MAG TPA: sulfotransferase [Parafilimonas sp.]|nr:sulfotransferase [Parafilimonas sp.]
MPEVSPKSSDLPLIIYIISDKRSGSTLLEYLLSSHPDVFPLGELSLLHGHFNRKGPGERWNWNCSCGQPVAFCDFWKRIFARLKLTEAPFTSLEKKLTSNNLFKPVKQKIKESLDISKSEKEIIAVTNNCWEIYKAVFEQTGKLVITDSSKNAIRAWYLWKYRKGNIKFLILDRDIRAIAFSKMKRTTTNNAKENYSVFINLIGSYKVAKQNRLIGSAIESDGGKVMALTYDDLVTRRVEIISSVCNFMNLPIFSPPSEFEGHTQHTIAGSPHRFEKSKIVKDERWLYFYNKKPILSLLGKYLSNKG